MIVVNVNVHSHKILVYSLHQFQLLTKLQFNYVISPGKCTHTRSHIFTIWQPFNLCTKQKLFELFVFSVSLGLCSCSDISRIKWCKTLCNFYINRKSCPFVLNSLYKQIKTNAEKKSTTHSRCDEKF